ncbi:MAG: amidohydrolase [Lachnospiraceae bacterium]|nr:amidohydrolase [Lachnospiraceae bacterium]
MLLRLYNARILTMKDKEDIFFGEIRVLNNRIESVIRYDEVINASTAKDTVTERFDREIDCEGNLLMPGFKDAHTHSGMTAFRSLADDLNLQDWLNQEIFPREAKMTPEDCYTLTKLANLEYLTSGITAIGDMYLTPETIADACIETGMRCELVSGLNKFGSTMEVLEERYLKLNEKHPLIGFKMGVHAEYTCDRALLEKVSELIHKYKAPLFTHMSETKTEVDECKGRYGKTPVEFFDELGLFDFGGTIYHGVWTTPEDREILKKRKIVVVSNPASNAKLASGIAPLTDYLKEGIPVGLGTDGPSSNNCLDMFREMYLASVLGKLREMEPTAVPATEVLKMATVNGSLSLEHPDTDILARGKLADIIMIDLKQPNMQPILNIPNNLVYSGCKMNVKMTMIDGMIRYMDGKFYLNDAVEDIYEQSAKILERLK